jgi:hypothetical protein
MDELDQLRSAANRAAQFEGIMRRAVERHASPSDAKILLRLSATDQCDWLAANVRAASPLTPPPPPPPDPVAEAHERAKAEMRKRYRQVLG